MKKTMVLVILVLVLFSGFAAFLGNAQPVAKKENKISYVVEPTNYKILYYMEKSMGFRDPSKNYNIIIDGHGTGLAPPTVDEYAFLLEHGKYVRTVRNYRSKGSADLSTSPYFPPVGDQGSQGSCAAWATAYYDNTFYQARVHNWTDTHNGTNGHHLMSPAWTYNKANGGSDGGSSFIGNYMVMNTIGTASLATMPYNPSDYTSWGNELAWREAPVGRIPDIEYTDVSNIDVVKSWIDQGYLATFAINANVYTSPTGAFSDGNYIVSWEEYQPFYGQPNHAQTIVGYDDNITDDGDVGAFKVVNSWGASFGDHGFYWLTYNAFSHLAFNYTFRIIGSKPNKIHLLGIWQFSQPGPRDAPITVGIGDPNNPVGNRTLYLDGGSSKNFPYFMAADLTDYLSEWENGTEPFFLKIGKSSTGQSSVISGFWIEYYKDEYILNQPYRISWPSPDAPVTTPGYITNVLRLQNDLSDLVVYPSDIVISPSPVMVNHNMTITVTVSNEGVNTSYNVSVAIYKDRMYPYYLLGTIYLGDIPPGGNATGTLEITATKRFFGEHKLIVYVDPDRLVAELNESNNIVETTFVGVKGPSAPNDFSAIRGDGYVLLSWEPPSDDGGLPVIGYNIYRNGEKIASVDNKTFSYNDTSVDMREEYTYYVTASNAAGEGSKSYDIKISWSVPSEVLNLQALRGDGYVLLSWEPPKDNGGSKIVAYNIYRNGENIGSTSELTYNDSSVDMKVNYTYYVVAVNGVGEGNKSNEVSVAWSVPSAPQQLSLTRGDGIVTLSWKAPQDDGGTKILSYNIYRDGQKIATVDASSLSYEDKNLDVTKQYVYFVKAVNYVGESDKSNEVSVAWSVPSAPQQLSLTRGDGIVTLSWKAPQDDGGTKILSYNIYRDGQKIATVDAASLTYRDEGVDVKSQHTYYVTAVNAVGESEKSNEASVAWSVPSEPQNVKVKTTTGGALLQWESPADNGGSSVKKYEIFVLENGKWKRVGETDSTKYVLKLAPTLTGGTAKVKIVPVNGVGEGKETVVEVTVPVNLALWGAIIGVIAVIIIAAIVLVKRKK